MSAGKRRNFPTTRFNAKKKTIRRRRRRKSFRFLFTVFSFGLDGEYLEPFCKAERRASSPSPSLTGSGYDSSAGFCLDPDASRGPLSRAARARAPACRARTRPKDATRPRLAAALLRPKGQPAAAAPHVGRALGYAPAGTTSRRGGCGKMCPPRASTETGEDCSTSSRLYIFPRPPLPC